MDIRNFKIWLIQNKNENNDLFDQSLKCYQVEAYKAAYLYSYLGFLDYIRELILNYKGVPKQFNNKLKEKKDEAQIFEMWNKKKDNLKLEDIWENELFSIINEGLPHNIFLLKDNIRNEFIQKKDLRNVCVHNKTREITYSSVEDLWDFIAYAKGMIVVNGSVEVLKEKFEEIIEFTEEEQYKGKIRDLYDNYSKLPNTEREKFYEWLSDKLYMSILQADFTELKVYDELLKLILKSPNALEYEWTKDSLIDIYLYLTLENYNLINDSEDLKRYAFENENDFLTIIILNGDDDTINVLLEYIYSEKNLTKWWNIVLSVIDTFNSFNLSKQLMNLIRESNVLNELHEKIEARLTALDFSDDEFNELEIDYLLFHQFRTEIKIALILAKNGYMSESKIDLLKKTTKKMIEFNVDNLKIKNDITFKEFLQRDQSLYSWFINRV